MIDALIDVSNETSEKGREAEPMTTTRLLRSKTEEQPAAPVGTGSLDLRDTVTVLIAFTVITDLLIRGANSRFYTDQTLTNAEAAQVLREMKTII